MIFQVCILTLFSDELNFPLDECVFESQVKEGRLLNCVVCPLILRCVPQEIPLDVCRRRLTTREPEARSDEGEYFFFKKMQKSKENSVL